ncbi:MAG: hypothetical protein R2755_32540 [Acidimicrobiales bacterium]
MSTRFVVLGLARPRAGWFSEVGRWATSGSAPIDFIRCVSREEVAANLASGRGYSALLVDGASLELDRDLVEDLRRAGSATIVVDDGSVNRDWGALGVHAVLHAGFGRTDLLVTLDAHATALEGRATTLPAHQPEPAPPRIGAPAPGGGSGGGDVGAGRWVSVVGDGAGTSVLAMALAQAFADRRGPGEVVLADLALDADQAMLHAAPDIVPGVSELVELHRGGAVAAERIRELTFAVDGRHYDLLLGLRRHRDWAALRPRAVHAALEGLAQTYPVVVADCEADVEGEDDCGSVEVEERNGLTRAALQRADAVVVVGTATLTGVHRLVRLVGELRRFGVPAERLLVVVNQAPRQARARAELATAIGALTALAGPSPYQVVPPDAATGPPRPGPGTAPRAPWTPAAGAVAAPLFVGTVRRLDAVLRDGGRLPASLGERLAASIGAVLDTLPPRTAPTSGPVAIKPGELGAARRERAAS